MSRRALRVLLIVSIWTREFTRLRGTKRTKRLAYCSADEARPRNAPSSSAMRRKASQLAIISFNKHECPFGSHFANEWKPSTILRQTSDCRTAQGLVRPSEAEATTARAAEQGADVITLGQGESDFETSLAACEAGICAIRGGPTKCTRGEQAAARGSPRTSVAITGSIPVSIRPRSFAARSRSCSTRTLQVSIPGQRRFGGRRNDWLVRSV